MGSGGVEMKGVRVIVAGLGRTGTMSMQAALDTLGYKSYHMGNLALAPGHLKAWKELGSGKREVENVLDLIVNDGFDATMDNPMADVFADQAARFPDAKVILTLHPKGAKGWATSFKKLLQLIRTQSAPFSLSYPNILLAIPFFRDMNDMRCIMGTRTMGLPPCELIYGALDKPSGWLEELYDKHNAKVRATVSKLRLLEYNVTQGWEPLCIFLDHDSPQTDFPKLNDSASLNRLKIALQVVVYGWPFLFAIMAYMLYRCGLRQRKAKLL